MSELLEEPGHESEHEGVEILSELDAIEALLHESKTYDEANAELFIGNKVIPRLAVAAGASLRSDGLAIDAQEEALAVKGFGVYDSRTSRHIVEAAREQFAFRNPSVQQTNVGPVLSWHARQKVTARVELTQSDDELRIAWNQIVSVLEVAAYYGSDDL